MFLTSNCLLMPIVRRVLGAHATSMNDDSHKIFQLLILLTCMSFSQAFIGNDADLPSKYDAELMIEDEPVSLDTGLADLLRLRQSIEVLEKLREQLANHGQALDPDAADGKELPTEKRVFCNGFTGCGGRFRGRRVQQRAMQATRNRRLKSSASKRPFCNKNGCNKGGKRKTSTGLGGALDADDTFAMKDNFDIVKQDMGRAGASKPKRLFCNGYGGCRNMGKRKSLIPLLSARESSSGNKLSLEDQKPLLRLLLQPNKDKRFFASSFDSNMDNFVNNL